MGNYFLWRLSMAVAVMVAFGLISFLCSKITMYMHHTSKHGAGRCERRGL